MIYDKGKFIITVVVTLGLMSFIGICLVTKQEVPSFVVGAFASSVTYVYVNGKQLTASGAFTPSPMIVPNPERAAALLEREVAPADPEQTR